uniref:SWIM-type domain-containing protein n=1 Tax=Brassica oleracea var. oleracea TaxID=109376 RepID=A0A0D3E584_BRAOL
MSNGDPMFLNMCEAGKWRGMINIFLVNTTEHCEVEEQVMPSEEEIRIENNVASFVDEDENFDHHNTPPNSDDEDNESFVRFRPGSGELELRQVFDTIEEFKEAVLEYALKGGWNIKLNKWGDIKSSAVCGTKEDCPWRIYCSYEERIGKWMVKTFSDKHRCQKDGYCKLLKSAVICKLFLNDIRTDPELKPRFIQDQIEQRYNLIATIDKCKKGKAKAIDIINHDHEEQFSRLKDYRLALLELTIKLFSGLLNAVERILPNVEHRMCARHIYGNLKKLFPRQHEIKTLFWRVAESCTVREYEANLEAVKRYDLRLYEAIMEKNPMNCSLAFFSPTSSCVDVHNNISESFNNAIDPARYMPMVEMLETIRRTAMVRIDMRKKKAADHIGRFPSRIMKMIDKEQEKLKFCKMIPGGDGRCEVREGNVSHSVNMRLRTCACRRWDMSGIPCRHALRIITEKKLDYEDYISSFYLNSRQQQIYSDSIRPVNGMCFWDRTGASVLPPPSLVENTENNRGRKPKPKRKKGRNESPTRKKVSRDKRIMHCGRCGVAGHNATKCPNIGVPIKHKYGRKKASTGRVEEHDPISEDFGEGPSQQTQD